MFPQLLFITSITLMCKRYYALLVHKNDKDRAVDEQNTGKYMSKCKIGVSDVYIKDNNKINSDISFIVCVTQYCRLFLQLFSTSIT